MEGGGCDENGVGVFPAEEGECGGRVGEIAKQAGDDLDLVERRAGFAERDFVGRAT